MQGNLNIINSAVLMHFDVVGNGRVILSLLDTLDTAYITTIFKWEIIRD